MTKTKIEWTEHTWNPVTGCSKVSTGCLNCYAERMARRMAGRYGYPEMPKHFDVTLRPERLGEPLKRKKPTMYFVCSMSDLFHEDVPDAFIFDVLEVIAQCPQHIFQLLTKRPKRLAYLFRQARPDAYSNLWLGVSVENQKTADERIPILLQIPALHFVSLEPLLGPVNFTIGHDNTLTGEREMAPFCYDDWGQKLGWIIVGGESGPGARPMHPDWARSARDQCQTAGVPFFFKQWGAWKKVQYDKRGRDDILVSPTRGEVDALPDPFGGDGAREEYKRVVAMERIGKARAGRLLDGRTWDEMPRGASR